MTVSRWLCGNIFIIYTRGCRFELCFSLPPANEVYRCVSVHRGVQSQHAFQVVSQHALQQVSRGVLSQHALQVASQQVSKGVSRPTTKGEVEGDLVQAHSQGGSWGGSGPGPQPRGKLRGNWSRPTAKGEVEGDLPGGYLVLGVACSHGGLVPAPGGAWWRPPPRYGYCCWRYASYWNALLL